MQENLLFHLLPTTLTHYPIVSQPKSVLSSVLTMNCDSHRHCSSGDSDAPTDRLNHRMNKSVRSQTAAVIEFVTRFIHVSCWIWGHRENILKGVCTSYETIQFSVDDLGRCWIMLQGWSMSGNEAAESLLTHNSSSSIRCVYAFVLVWDYMLYVTAYLLYKAKDLISYGIISIDLFELFR